MFEWDLQEHTDVEIKMKVLTRLCQHVCFIFTHLSRTFISCFVFFQNWPISLSPLFLGCQVIHSWKCFDRGVSTILSQFKILIPLSLLRWQHPKRVYIYRKIPIGIQSWKSWRRPLTSRFTPDIDAYVNIILTISIGNKAKCRKDSFVFLKKKIDVHMTAVFLGRCGLKSPDF